MAKQRRDRGKNEELKATATGGQYDAVMCRVGKKRPPAGGRLRGWLLSWGREEPMAQFSLRRGDTGMFA